MNIDYTGIRELDLIILEDTLHRKIQKYYAEKLKKAIGSQIKTGRKEKYMYIKWLHYESALDLLGYGVKTELLSVEETNGILREIKKIKRN